MKVKYVPIFALVGVLSILSGMPLSLSGGSSSTNYAFARYANTNTQTQPNSNECTAGSNCGITSPQTQGDGTANSPINTQTIESIEVSMPNPIPPTVGEVVFLLRDCTNPDGLFFLECNIFIDFTRSDY